MRHVRFTVGLLLLCGTIGAAAWLAIADVPAPQSQITVAIPADHFSSNAGGTAP